MIEALLKWLSPQGFALPSQRNTPPEQHRIDNTRSATPKNWKCTCKNTRESEILGCADFSTTSPSTRATSPAAVGFDSPLHMYTRGGEILGCYDYSATSPSTGASSVAAVDLVAPVPLVPLLPGSATAASCFPPSRRVGEWIPHRSDCSTARPTAPAPAHPIQQRLSSTGSVLSPSSLAAAASWASPMNS